MLLQPFGDSHSDQIETRRVAACSVILRWWCTDFTETLRRRPGVSCGHRGMSCSSSDEELFRMAGLEKDSFLGRWDFLFTSPFGSPPHSAAASSSAANQSAGAAAAEAERMKLIDSIDLDNLPASEPSTPMCTVDVGERGSVTEVKKKKKPKKKKAAGKQSDRSVKWGDVEQICFSRSIGYDRIPNKGSYPIGLGVEKERLQSTIDQLYTAQQQYLLQKAVAKGLHFKSTEATPPPPPPPPPVHSPSPQVPKGRKNHRSRSNSVASVDSVPDAFTAGIDVLQPLETRQYDYRAKATNPLFQPLGEDERIALLTSGNADIVSDPHSNANPLTEVNNEIKQLKAHRETSGCSCKHLKADKLSIAKLKSELLANRHLAGCECTPEEVEAMPKAELMRRVKEVLKHCVLCVTNDCQCVQLGIQCSAQLCGCLRGGHNPGLAQACANPEGMDLYDPERVKKYRRAVLDGLHGIGGSDAASATA